MIAATGAEGIAFPAAVEARSGANHMRGAIVGILSLVLLASAEAHAQSRRPSLGFDDAPAARPKSSVEESQAPPTLPFSPPTRVPEPVDVELPHLAQPQPQPAAVSVAEETLQAGTPIRANRFRTGGGAMYLKPYFDTNPAFARAFNVQNAGSGTTSTTQENFNWSYGWAPLGWIEYGVADGLGLRGRFWQFYGSPMVRNVTNDFVAGTLDSTQVVSAFPLGLGITSNPAGAGAGFNDQLSFRSSLGMQTYDLEATRDFRGSFIWVSMAAGGRYVETTQSYDASLRSTPAVPGAASVATDLYSSHHYSGFGGTVFLEVGMPLLESRWSVYANGRGSMIFGTQKESASLNTVTVPPGGVTTTQLLTAYAQQDRLLPITELEVGTEYFLRWGRSEWFARAGLIHQVWFGAGNAANNQTITGTGAALTVPLTQVADNHINLGLFGLLISGGVRY